MRRILVVVAAFVLGATAAWAAGTPRVVVKQILATTNTASGQLVSVPPNPEVIVSTYEIPVGAVLPFHKHPFQRYAYVLAGELSVVNRDTDETYNYKAGDFIVEVVDQWHMGRNDGKTRVKLLVIDQVEPGKANVVMAPQ
jgi:quercetin dioxygenase-like cupin family protein